MDPLTATHYASTVTESTAKYETLAPGSGISAFFPMAFPAGSRVLDIGAGSGRDLDLLLSSGYDAYGVDASPVMVSQALKDHPALSGRFIEGSLPADKAIFGGDFDGILCSAVLQHIEDENLLDAAFSIRESLAPGGILLLSVPHARPDVGMDNRLPDGRLFIMRTAGQYDLLFERLGFVKVFGRVLPDGLGREGVLWDIMLYRRESADAVRSIDKIESVINRDSKTATYKLALLRALSEIALSEYNTVLWTGNDSVKVPLRRIAEKLLYFYWPIFESADFIPQINGERPGCRLPVKFRGSMSTLIGRYRLQGGMSSFHNDFIRGGVGNDLEKQLAAVLKDIEITIVKGPAHYTRDSGEGRLFGTEGSKYLLVPSPIWKELCLLGNWIGDALVLRWGELTSRMSNGEVPASRVIDLLLQRPTLERDVAVSRDLFIGMPSLECVWSGRSLTDKTLHVDHVIPYSLWRNNDLWNLLPSHASVNNQKSDRLPSRDLLKKRRDDIIGVWEYVHAGSSNRFTLEADRLIGRHVGPNWQSSLFSALTDAIEITALQRGVERWNI